MAGTFTHWMVVEEALDRYRRRADRHRFFPDILGLNHFVCLGAVGPDYPYCSELAGGFIKIHSWADRMHYENTAEFIRRGVMLCGNLGGGALNACLAWLCGYAAHLVTDSMMHPVVQAIVGPYIFNSGDHRHCELVQDSYIFHRIKRVEIAYGDYVRLFEMCSDSKDKHKINSAIKQFWTEALKASHPAASAHFDTIKPDDWHKHFITLMSAASDPKPIFRHIGEDMHVVYKRTDRITAEEKNRYIDRVKLPGGGTGAFDYDVFDKTVNAVMDAWHHLFADVENKNPGGTFSYLRNWNLDTGVDEDAPYYWQ